jgi:hypothetical protein
MVALAIGAHAGDFGDTVGNSCSVQLAGDRPLPLETVVLPLQVFSNT